MTKVICFTGPQGTGKTTMRKALIADLQGRGYSTIEQYPGMDDNTSISREAKQLGFKINEETNFQTQYYIALEYCKKDLILRKQIEEEIEVDFVVLDRSVLDVIPYVMASPNIEAYQKEILRTMLIRHFQEYSAELIFCQPIGLDLQPDRDRSLDPDFQQAIHHEFTTLLEDVGEFHQHFVLDTGTIEARLEWILQEVL